MALSDIDPLDLYDCALADWIEVDRKAGTNYKAQFIEKFGTREEFAQKIGVPVVVAATV